MRCGCGPAGNCRGPHLAVRRLLGPAGTARPPGSACDRHGRGSNGQDDRESTLDRALRVRAGRKPPGPEAAEAKARRGQGPRHTSRRRLDQPRRPDLPKQPIARTGGAPNGQDNREPTPEPPVTGSGQPETTRPRSRRGQSPARPRPAPHVATAARPAATTRPPETTDSPHRRRPERPGQPRTHTRTARYGLGSAGSGRGPRGRDSRGFAPERALRVRDGRNGCGPGTGGSYAGRRSGVRCGRKRPPGPGAVGGPRRAVWRWFRPAVAARCRAGGGCTGAGAGPGPGQCRRVRPHDRVPGRRCARTGRRRPTGRGRPSRASAPAPA